MKYDRIEERAGILKPVNFVFRTLCKCEKLAGEIPHRSGFDLPLGIESKNFPP
ncbi:hypothetical protein [Rhizobium cremeum]|uniref:hypothetical protein n=1 Tax=Rhizobium cremeum TaxID=2813827 RepID=UPI001FD2C191|nr:hypothetical protein [Rhizobium cremeum]